jgi:hypothetical protein
MIVCRKVIIVVALCLLGSITMHGCATSKKITDDIMGRGRSLKKKMAFLPTANDSLSRGKDFQEEVSAKLKAVLSRSCHNLSVMDSRHIREALERLPRLHSGQIDSLAFANLGRILGLGAVLEHGITEIQCFTDKRGMWGFRNTCLFARLSFRVRAYDVETTAVLFDEIIENEVELSEEAWEKVKSDTKHNQEISLQLLDHIVPEIGEKICMALAAVPWKGYITGSSQGTFTISAGEEVGLATGDVLEVFGIGEPIEGQGGQVYLVSGPKIGEIKVTKVKRHQAEAISISGSDLEKSCCVKLKP